MAGSLARYFRSADQVHVRRLQIQRYPLRLEHVAGGDANVLVGAFTALFKEQPPDLAWLA